MNNKIKTKPLDLLLQARIENKIFLIRRERVMFDYDLANIYRVETKQLKRQVNRNKDRFPSDFMFQLNKKEYDEFLRCQFGTLKQGCFSKYLPYVFTEKGVAMLSSVLNSKEAIQVNIQIMRVFVRVKEILTEHKDWREKIEAMEKEYKKEFIRIFFEIYKLEHKVDKLFEDKKSKKPIGFKIE